MRRRCLLPSSAVTGRALAPACLPACLPASQSYECVTARVRRIVSICLSDTARGEGGFASFAVAGRASCASALLVAAVRVAGGRCCRIKFEKYNSKTELKPSVVVLMSFLCSSHTFRIGWHEISPKKQRLLHEQDSSVTRWEERRRPSSAVAGRAPRKLSA